MKRFLALMALMLMTCAIAVAADEENQTVDPRLDQKVTFEVGNTQLADAVKQLSAATKVTFTAGNNSRDWRVREQRITVATKDITLQQLTDQICSLLGYRLTRSGKPGQWEYLFWQDKKARDLEDELVNAAKEAAAQRSEKMRQGALDDASQALAMSEEEAMKLKESDPWMAYLGGTKTGRAYAGLLSGLGGSAALETDLMLRGKQVDIPLSGDMASIAAAAADGGIMGSLRKAGMPIPQVAPTGVTVMPIGDMGGAGGDALGFGGMVFITGAVPGGSGEGPFGGGVPVAVFPLCGAGSVVGNAFGKMCFALDEGASLQDAMSAMQADASNPDFLADMLARESQTEANPPTDPQLTREVELAGVFKDFKGSKGSTDPKLAEKKQIEAIDEIARATGYQVFFESFKTTLPIPMFVRAGKQPVWKIFAGLEKGGYTWALDGNLLRVRPDDWALLRSYAIASAFLEECKATMKNQGMFSLDDLSYIVTSLTDDQIKNTLIAETDLTMAIAPLISPMGNSREMLRFYGSLDVQQKAALGSEAGLRFGRLSARQWDRLGAIVSDKLGGAYITDGAVRMKVEGMPKPAQAQAQAQAAPAGMDLNAMADTKTAIFSINVLVRGSEKAKNITEAVAIMGKSSIAEMQKAQKAAEAAAETARKNTKPAPAQGQPTQ